MVSRRETIFRTTSGFEKDHDALTMSDQVTIDRYINRFESEYKKSTTNMDLPNGYNIEVYESNPYKLWQIYIAGNFRAFVLFEKDEPEGFWISVFRKKRQRELREIEKAKNRARDFWTARRG